MQVNEPRAGGIRNLRHSSFHMVNGVVSLRCPACTRPFLSLPQQVGARVTCPHCAGSAPYEAFPIAASATGHAVTSLPIQRRVIPARPTFQPGPSTANPLPAAAVLSSPPQPPSWPPAPEQRPLCSPAVSSPFPPAPVAMPAWPPVMATGASPFGVAVPSSPTLFLSQSGAPVPDPVAIQAAPPKQTVPAMSLQSAENPVAVDQTYTPVPSWKPQRDERNVPLGILLVLVLGFGGWLFWQSSQPPLSVEFRAPERPTAVAEGLSEKKPSPPLLPAPSPVSMPEPEITPEPEIRRAELPLTPGVVPVVREEAEVDLVEAGKAAEGLVKVLLGSSSLDERLSTIAQSDEHRVDMEEFFGRGSPKLKSFKPADVTPRTLPGQELVPLFQITTDLNRKAGALIRGVPQEGGGFLMDWPLFAETHDRRLNSFLEKKSEQPSWFYVVLRRSHGLELPEAVRAQHLCMNLQASADGSVQQVAVTPADTPLARFLEREAEWGTVYVGRLLLQHRPQAGGAPLVVILDCEGAVTGAVFPSGALKR